MTEAIVLVQAVRHGLVGVEQAALLGGVLSNMLLVVGLSFIVGGVATGGTQTFDRRVTVADIGVLLVSVIAVVLPTIAASAPGGNERDTLADSRSTAVVLLFMYAAFLVYTLSPGQSTPKSADDPESVQLLPIPKPEAAAEADDEADELPSMSLWTLLILLVLVTLNMAVLSNALVLNVFPVSAALNITADLVSCVFLPIIGNIAELSTAVIAARRGAVDLSLAVAFGSSTQISLFLLPMAAMLGWAIGVPFSFDFSPTFTTVRAQTADTAACLRVLTSARLSLQAFFASVIVVAVVVSDGEATWLKGIMLCGTYTIFCIGLLTNAGAAGVGGPASAPAAAQAAG
jgi:Ca2+:H+ antiporter